MIKVVIFMKKIYKKSIKVEGLIIILIVFMIGVLAIGFSSFAAELSIRDISAVVRVQKDIRINGITLSSIGGNATSVDEDYNIDNISSNITLPLQNS